MSAPTDERDFSGTATTSAFGSLFFGHGKDRSRSARPGDGALRNEAVRGNLGPLKGQLAGLGLVGLLCLVGCEKSTSPREQKPAAAKVSPGPSSATARPRRAFDVDVSAYRARIDFEGETLVLATARGLELATEGLPPSVVPRAFGDTFALSGARVVYFEEGQLLESLRGAPPRVLGSVPAAPGAIVHEGGHLAWLEHGPSGTSRISTFQAGKARELVRLAGRVDTMTLLGSWVFFFEGRAGTWRLGGVSLDGGTPVFRPWESGRVPATLEGRDDLYYYDGPTRSVRRVSPDLSREVVLASGLICSPLAVSDRVICGHVGGLTELPLDGGPPKKLVVQGSLISGLAATERSVAWISDTGADRLIVQTLNLPPAR